METTVRRCAIYYASNPTMLLIASTTVVSFAPPCSLCHLLNPRFRQ